MKKILYIDVTYGSDEALHSDSSFNDLLRPFQLLVRRLESSGIEVRSSTSIPKKPRNDEIGLYYSFRSHRNFKKYIGRPDIIFGSFYIMEPVIVRPDRYKQLPLLTKYFQKVYLPNTGGFGYSLKNVQTDRLRQIYFPQAYDTILDECWSSQKQHTMMIINANKLPVSYKNELYGERVKALVELQKYMDIDLYGRGWKSWKKKGSFRPIFLFNRKKVLSHYKGEVDSKFKLMSHYKYNLCMENMVMPGYVSEKIFDSFFAGTVPVYLGAPDISDYIPEDCYIDMRKFNNYKELSEYILNMSDNDYENKRKAILQYIASEKYMKYFSTTAFVENTANEVLEIFRECKI